MGKTISIGGAEKDAELIKEILAYQKQRGLTYASDAVRELCKDALAIKKTMR